MGVSNSNSASIDLVPNEVDEEKVFLRLKKMHLAAFIFMGIQAIGYGAAIGNTTSKTTPTVSFQGEDKDTDDCSGLSCHLQIRSVGV
jgi:hypothetical protein